MDKEQEEDIIRICEGKRVKARRLSSILEQQEDPKERERADKQSRAKNIENFIARARAGLPLF